ncbi:hypothetical protein NQ314_010058 [Rhamnusium bicolor]|uniref:Uncharacterized protein n=1 Tax=Rhamnusium bicolor TaxID=1586634 RepID=A0AAV8XVD5_9CUCU|nr:hypothetical protein NQ314_010058 [Rhamnusium bicolor]
MDGQEYISPNTKKTVPARYMRNRCNSATCKIYGKNCSYINDEQRRKIFDVFNKIGDLHLQRVFLTRHLELRGTKRTTTNKEKSRRQHTIIYKLTVDNEAVVVCKKLFLNTLGITENMCRTALSKINDLGVLVKEKKRWQTKE